jgi:hypothetical protein
MSRQELLLKIEELNVPSSLYSIQGKLAYGVNLDCYQKNMWRVFILDERGNYIEDQSFVSEDKANDCFFQLLNKIATLIRKK